MVFISSHSSALSYQVDSVHKQGYQVAFLASKKSVCENEILSLHGGLTLNIQKQLEVNFKQLITGLQVYKIISAFPCDLKMILL